jgi:hypothetical protein
VRKKGENNIKPPAGYSCDPLDETMISPLVLKVKQNRRASESRRSHEQTFFIYVGDPTDRPNWRVYTFASTSCIFCHAQTG